MKNNMLLVFCIVAALMNAACSVSSSEKMKTDIDTESLLVQTTSSESFLELYKSAYTTDRAKSESLLTTDVVAPPVADSASGSASQSKTYSTTYKIEAEVDEHDLVKNNASHIFIAPSKQACCFAFRTEAIQADSGATPGGAVTEEASRGIRVLKADPDTASISQETIIEIPEEKSIEGMFLKDNQLIAIDSTAYWGVFGDTFAGSIYNWSNQESGLNFYNIQNPKQVQQNWELKSNGGFVDSRLIGDMLYLVLRHTPNVDPSNLEALKSEDLLPTVTINGTKTQVFETNECYISNINHPDFSGEVAYPTITYVLAIDIQNKNIANHLCYSEDITGIYVSENNMFFAQHVYDQKGSHAFVHQFALNTGLAYKGSAKLPGSLYGAAALDFRLSEYNGYLRVVTSKWNQDSSDRIDHNVYVLKASEGSKDLAIVSQLPNTNRPKAIGKPNEDLRGVRFFGSKAYLVTFETIDPLYVLDLSNPEDPFIAGELEIPGFSDFLHPVGDELLLGIGRDSGNYAKVELYDVSNMSNPLSIKSISLGSDAISSYTQAQYNRKAFTYLDINEDTARFAIPLQVTQKKAEANNGEGALVQGDLSSLFFFPYLYEDQLHLFEISNKNTASNANLNAIGPITAKDHPNSFGGSLLRSVFMKDSVYFISDDKVWSAFWQNPGAATGPH